MSRAYKVRLNAIRDEKKRRGVPVILPVDFAYLQANWSRALDGPCLGTLEQLISKIRSSNE